MSENVG